MRAETVKRMILLSVAEPPEDLEELLELHARLWARENAELLTEGRREPVNGNREEDASVPQPENIPEPQPEPEEDAPKEERKWNENAILGFAHIRCAHCGAEKTFTAKHWMNRYTCGSCGQLRAGDLAARSRPEGRGAVRVRGEERLLHQRGGGRL